MHDIARSAKFASAAQGHALKIIPAVVDVALQHGEFPCHVD
jgi:hypothetical protein